MSKPSSISDKKIEKAWKAVGLAVEKGTLAALMKQFGKAHPTLLEFLSEASSQWQSDTTDVAFYAVLVIWKSFYSKKDVRAEALVEFFKKNERWMAAFKSDGILTQKKLQDVSQYSQPELMRFVSDAIFESHEDGFEIEPHEQLQLFLVLKTIVDSFSKD